MSRRKRPVQTLQDEEGATLVMVAVIMVGLLIMVGLVLDFGLVRTDRQQNKSTADFSAAAGTRALEWSDGVPRPFRGVCEAYRYLRANSDEMNDITGSLKSGDGSTVHVASGDPCTHPDAVSRFDQKCVPGDKTTWAWFDGLAGGGRIHVDIKSGYLLDDGGFSDEALISGDDGDSAQAGCDQLAVIIGERQNTSFGAAAGVDRLRTSVRSVGRVTIGKEGNAVAALVLLERVSCRSANVEGDSGAKIVVRGLATAPGIIHADSLGNDDLPGGDASSCGGDLDTENVLNLTVGPAPASPLIVAEQAGDGTPGLIRVRALGLEAGAIASNASDPWPTHVNAEGQPNGAPLPGSLLGRRPIDRAYLSPVKAMRNEAAAAWAAPAPGQTVLGCALPATVTDQKVFVDCPGGLTLTSNVTFSAADAEIVFNGPVAVGGKGTVLEFSNPRKIYVRGSTSVAGFQLEGEATLNVNLDGRAECPGRADYSSETDPERRETTRFVVGRGPFTTSGQASLRMCQTTLFLADSSGATPCPLPAAASDNDPPYSNNCRGRISIAGKGDVDWSAPNRTSKPPGDDDIAQLEDLSFWTETSAVPGSNCAPKADLNCVQGNGLLRLKGVFALPNANPFRIAGNGSQNIAAPAQFWTRKLTVGGKGVLSMAPNPDDAIAIPIFRDFVLVR